MFAKTGPGQKWETEVLIGRPRRCQAARFAVPVLPSRRVYHPNLDLLRHEAFAALPQRKDYNLCVMYVAVLFMRLCEIAFFAGIAGSAVVVVISFIEDIHELLGD